MYDKMGAHVMTRSGARPAPTSACGLRMQLGVGGRRLQWVEPAIASSACAGKLRHLGRICSGSAKVRCTSTTSCPTITGHRGEKTDPFGLLHEKPPRTASVVWDLDYQWDDSEWMENAGERQFDEGADVHLRSASGFVDAVPEERNRPLTYRETAPSWRIRQSWALRMWNSAGHGASVLRLVGLSDHGILRAHGATARRRISCTWWIICTSTASA